MSTFLTLPTGCIAKQRFKKTYRHPDLDQQLTAKRVNQEARNLQKCKKAGMDTPTVYFIDIPESTIYMENITGITVKQRLLDDQHEDYKNIDMGNIYICVCTCQISEPFFFFCIDLLAQKIGTSLAKMHSVNVVHGDLTTSNLMIRTENDSLVK